MFSPLAGWHSTLRAGYALTTHLLCGRDVNRSLWLLFWAVDDVNKGVDNCGKLLDRMAAVNIIHEKSGK